jgi:hypothetical protein
MNVNNTSSIRNILVLEDYEGRIEWLTENVPFNVNIHWHSQVKDFIDAYPKFVWDLIIFDCDLTPDEKFDFDDALGLFVPKEDNNWHKMLDRDNDGLNGVDAASQLINIPGGVDKNIPCLIWSANSDGALEIKNLLIDNGFQNVVRSKYDTYFLYKLKTQIQHLLGF